MKKYSKLNSTLFDLVAIILNHYSLLVLYWMLTDNKPIQGVEFELGNVHLTISRWLDPLFVDPFIVLTYVLLGNAIKKIVRNIIRTDFYQDITIGSYEKNVTKICSMGIAGGIGVGIFAPIGMDFVIAIAIGLGSWMGGMLISTFTKELYNSFLFLRPRFIIEVVISTSANLGLSFGITAAIISMATSWGSVNGLLLGFFTGSVVTISSLLVGLVIGFITPVMLEKSATMN